MKSIYINTLYTGTNWMLCVCTFNIYLLLTRRHCRSPSPEVGIYRGKEESKKKRLRKRSQPKLRPRKRSRKKESFYFEKYILINITFNHL